jgi:hypothetical protein
MDHKNSIDSITGIVRTKRCALMRNRSLEKTLLDYNQQTGNSELLLLYCRLTGIYTATLLAEHA